MELFDQLSISDCVTATLFGFLPLDVIAVPDVIMQPSVTLLWREADERFAAVRIVQLS